MPHERGLLLSGRRRFRRIVLPGLWLVIGFAIAASLVKLAFVDGASGASDDHLQPTGEVPAETVPAETGTVANTLTVDGTIELDPARPVVAPVTGTISGVYVVPGATVAAGDRLFQIRTETLPEGEAAPPPSEGGEPVSPPAPRPRVTWTNVVATAGGKVGGISLAKGDEVTKGGTMASVQPQSFRAVGSITPLDRYRLLTAPKTAVVTIPGGPKPFVCQGLEIGDTAAPAPSGGEEGGPEGGSDGGDSASRISCMVPATVKVFDGLTMAMEIDAGAAKQVLVVPVTAVRGLLGSGSVWVVGPDGAPAERPVELGVTDGKVVEVKSGLTAGDLVLRYVPGSQPVRNEECPPEMGC